MTGLSDGPNTRRTRTRTQNTKLRTQKSCLAYIPMDCNFSINTGSRISPVLSVPFDFPQKSKKHTRTAQILLHRFLRLLLPLLLLRSCRNATRSCLSPRQSEFLRSFSLSSRSTKWRLAIIFCYRDRIKRVQPFKQVLSPKISPLFLLVSPRARALVVIYVAESDRYSQARGQICDAIWLRVLEFVGILLKAGALRI